jgi:hypothetical protein
MTNDEIWNCETPVIDLLFCEIPSWIEQDIAPYDVAAIVQGGCASGAYMPAVTYHRAAAVMADHGDDVLDYITQSTGHLPLAPADTSWSGLACFYLSCAVELWSSGIHCELEELETKEPNPCRPTL